MKEWTTQDVLKKIKSNSDYYSASEASALNDWFNQTSLDEITSLDVSVLQELISLLGIPIESPCNLDKLDKLRNYINDNK